MNDYLEIVERRFVFHRNGEELFGGTPDRVLIYPQRKIAVVIDRKFGRKEVQAAELNDQLRAYLCMVSEEFPSQLYYGAIVQPRFSSRAFTVCYTPRDIAIARKEIEAAWDEAHKPDAKRNPSPGACAFCRGQPVCEEFRAQAFAIESVKHLPAAQWTPVQWDSFLSWRSAAIKFLDDRYKDAKAIKRANPDALPGWEFRDGAEHRIITDIIGAYAILTGKALIDAKSFSECCKLNLGDLEETLCDAAKKGGSKLSQREVKHLINKLLGHIIALRRNEPSLVRVK